MGGLVSSWSARESGMSTRKQLTVPPPLVDTVYTDTLFHFFNFKTDESSVGIAVAMVLN
jgi:hypothetical protein